MRAFMMFAALAALGMVGCAQAPQTAGDVAAQAQPVAPAISQDALLNRMAARDGSVLVIDVRSAQEYAAGHVPGAINIPHDAIDAHLDELQAAQGKDIVVYCESGKRASMATEALRQRGFDKLLHLDGYMVQWRARGRPQER